MFSVCGPIAILFSVGFTKKPRQLIAKANVASAATAPRARICDLVDDIVLWDSLSASAQVLWAPLLVRMQKL